MTDLLKDILLSPFGSFASVFSLFTAAFWLVHWITKKVTEIRTSQEKIESSVDNVYKRIDNRVDKIEGHIDDIRRDISFLKAVVDVSQFNSKQEVAQRKSPISLTEIGHKIAEELKAEDMLGRNWDRIFDNLETNINDKNAYDIQQYCIETATIDLGAFIEKSDVDTVKKTAYKDGRPLAFYAPIFGVLIRDKYLNQKGIDISEVDKHDPSRAMPTT
jgi:hypothetical protein